MYVLEVVSVTLRLGEDTDTRLNLVHFQVILDINFCVTNALTVLCHTLCP